MDHKRISSFHQRYVSDWIKWKYNLPAASHLDDVWERQIRSVSNVLAALTKRHGKDLDDESLRTIRTEVEAVINSRPLTVKIASDSSSLIPVAPSNIPTLTTSVVIPPHGSFKEQIYIARKDGNVFSTLLMNFGQDRENNS